jgi:oxalate decarboxylase/phosphoglucose isomerase-like protein (cupin superfamily)
LKHLRAGEGRITLFASSHNARTFNYQAGDIGALGFEIGFMDTSADMPSIVAYIPASFGHYVENTGNTTLRYLEIFNTGENIFTANTCIWDRILTRMIVVDHYQDVSLSQWLALTPPAIVKAHLNVSDATIALMSKTKQVVV